MRRARWILVAAGLLGAEVPSGQRSGEELRFGVDSDAAVRIFNLVGRTRVTGWAHDSVVVVAVVPRGGGKLYGGGSGRMAKVGIEGQKSDLTGPGAVLDVKVPRGARVWIKSAAAPVELADLTGEIEVTSVTGAVTLTGSPRVSTIETIDGEVTITGAATVIRTRTGSGNVSIDGARGDISVTTVQGSITLASPELLAAHLATVSGVVSVRADGLSIDGRLEVETHGGSATILLPAGIDARFDLSSVKGRVAAPIAGRPGPERLLRFAVGKKAGAGRGASVSVRSFSGDVAVDSNPGRI